MAVATNLGNDLQAAIFGILDGDATLQGLIGDDKVFDHVPDALAFPFVVIDATNSNDWNTHTFIGFKGTIQIRAWTQDKDATGRKAVVEIMDQIWILLNNQDLALANRVQINFRCQNQNVIREEDNQTDQGIMDFIFTFGGNET